MMDAPVIFFDKDGTLVTNVPYNIDPEKIALEQGVARSLRRLADASFHFVVVSNQSGVARGLFKEEALGPVADRLNELVEGACGVRLDGFYYCPHLPTGTVPEYSVDCDCRKPKPGLLIAAARDLGIEISQAWMVGDILDDVAAGKHAGCRTILIDNGHETEWKDGIFRTPDYIAGSMEEAADIILAYANISPEQRHEETGWRHKETHE